MFFTLGDFLLIILLFKMATKCSAEVLSGARKPKKAVMCLTEEIHALEKLYSSMSYSAAGREFNSNG